MRMRQYYQKELAKANQRHRDRVRQIKGLNREIKWLKQQLKDLIGEEEE